MSKATLLSAIQADLDHAVREHAHKAAILAGLPDDLPVSVIIKTGYCADATICLDASGDLLAALQQLPPKECQYVNDVSSWAVKPTSHVRDNEARHAVWALPINRKTSPSGKDQEIYCWWADVAGKLVAFQAPVTDATAEALGNYVQSALGKSMALFRPVSHSYATGHATLWTRLAKQVSDLQLLSPMEQWYAQWEDFGKSRNYTESQLRFCAWLQGIAEFRDTVDEPSRDKPKESGRWPHFWDVFTEVEALELLDFARQQQAALPAIREEVKAQMAKVEAWCRTFFDQPYSFADERGARSLNDNFRYHLAKETGVAATVNFANFSRSDQTQIEVGITMDKQHVRLYLDNDPTLPLFDWESVAEYF